MIGELAIVAASLGNLTAGASLTWIYLHRRSCSTRQIAQPVQTEVIAVTPEPRERRETMRCEIGAYADLLARGDRALRDRLRRFEDGS